MKYKLTIITLLLVALFLTLAPAILASTTWYVNGVSGNDSNNCKLPTTACKTIGHAILLASSGDTIRVAAATYNENLTIGISLNVLGALASTTIVDGGAHRVVDISSVSAHVTLSGLTIRNGSAQSGGGIYSYSSGTLTVNNSTVSGNTAARAHCLFGCFGSGGGIAGTVKIQNSIVANNLSGGNCAGTITSEGYNLSSDLTCNFHSSGDRNNVDPKLGTLGYYGGPTQTIPLLAGSPAIDAGNPSGCTDGQGHLLKTDQRGMARPDKEDTLDNPPRCDMGAYERQSD